jgi:hypothetical protein
LVLADVNADALADTAAELDATGVAADVSDAAATEAGEWLAHDLQHSCTSMLIDLPHHRS